MVNRESNWSIEVDISCSCRGQAGGVESLIRSNFPRTKEHPSRTVLCTFGAGEEKFLHKGHGFFSTDGTSSPTSSRPSGFGIRALLMYSSSIESLLFFYPTVYYFY
jgi:hypothetical protein